MRDQRSEQLQSCLDRWRGGEEAARQELLSGACDRLTQIARTMLRSYPRLKRWEETDDVLQNALIRLLRTFETITPSSLRDFYRLATLQIRRELIDLIRHYYGPEGRGAKHATNNTNKMEQSSRKSAPLLYERADPGDEPSRLLAWTNFHEQIERLSEEERDVFGLIWYQGLAHTEAAEVLGVSAKTVKRRWQAACLHLHDALQGELPGSEP
jgi:RNA polymerase sigma factor (sigma-70 family)